MIHLREISGAQWPPCDDPKGRTLSRSLKCRYICRRRTSRDTRYPTRSRRRLALIFLGDASPIPTRAHTQHAWRSPLRSTHSRNYNYKSRLWLFDAKKDKWHGLSIEKYNFAKTSLQLIVSHHGELSGEFNFIFPRAILPILYVYHFRFNFFYPTCNNFTI